MDNFEAILEELREADAATDKRLDSIEEQLKRRIRLNQQVLQELKQLLGWVVVILGLGFFWASVPEADRAEISKDAIGKIIPILLGGAGIWLGLSKRS